MTQEPQGEEKPLAASGGGRKWLWWVVLLAMGWGFLHWRGIDPFPFKGEEKEESAGQRGKGDGKKGSKPAPVITAVATPGSIRVRLEALGTVIPTQWVVVRSRVEGQLLRLAVAEGEAVTAGQLLAEIDPRPFQIQLEQAKGQLERDQALLENARRDAARYQTLLKEDSVSRQQSDTQQALVRQYQGAVMVDQAQVDNAALQLSYTRITAPTEGVTGLRTVDPGNMVRQNDTAGLLSIAQVRPIQVLFTLSEENLPRLLAHWQKGESLPVELHDRERKNQLAEGKLLAMDNQIDTTTGTVKLKAGFANADGKLFPNQFVNVTVILETRPSALLLPSAAVQRGRKGTYVYRVQEDQTVQSQPVKIGPVQGELTAIEEGVQAGDKVVVEGVDKLKDGAKIEEVTRESPEEKGPKEKGSGAKEGRKKQDRPAGQGAGEKKERAPRE
ncbi:MAG: MdtA/MuxA family multidrug efflux RND transporter periplasmic adaptor subunit [Magnetococcus sp. YQC-3]